MPLLHVIPNLTRSLLCQLRQLKTSNNDKHSELAMKVTLDNICNSCDVVSFLSAVQLNKNLQKIIPPLPDIPPGSPLSLSLAPLQCHKALVLKVSGRSQISQLEFITQFFPELLFTSSHILLLFSPSPHLPLSHSPPHVP